MSTDPSKCEPCGTNQAECVRATMDTIDATSCVFGYELITGPIYGNNICQLICPGTASIPYSFYNGTACQSCGLNTLTCTSAANGLSWFVLCALAWSESGRASAAHILQLQRLPPESGWLMPDYGLLDIPSQLLLFSDRPMHRVRRKHCNLRTV